MIDLLYPGTEARYVVLLNGWLVGPIGPDGLDHTERFSNQHFEDYITETGGLYHENGVNHLHHDANLIYDPLRRKITPDPTSVYPQQINFSVKERSNVDVKYGRAGNGESSLYRPSSGNVYQNIFCQILGRGSWCIWSVTFLHDTNRVYTIKRYSFSVKKTTATKVYFDRTYTYLIVPGYPTVGEIVWNSQLTIDSFFEAWTYIASISRYSPKVSESVVAFPLTTAVYDWEMKTPKQIFDSVDAHVSTILKESIESAPQEKHFGELAMEACNRLDAINVNMIAFLRDFRRPLDMIPKLKNLRSLKGMSKNFLSVKYGILPTVSDLKSIIASFQRLRPSLDRDGFSTCYAGFTSYGSASHSTLTLVQRIKLGIAKEDNAFEALEEGLERIGMFPSFENLWDLVPYSFVLDWFVDVGNFLERIDTRVRLCRLNVRYATMSRKATVTSTVSHDQVPDTYGQLQRVQYHRWVNGHAPVPPLFLRLGLTSFNHWLESAALIIQRTR